MFTSRAEHRLFLREDNADARLTEHGRAAGLVSDGAYQKFLERQRDLAATLALLQETTVAGLALPGFAVHAKDNNGTKLDAILRKPQVSIEDLIPAIPQLQAISTAILRRAAIEIKYAGYIEREQRAIKAGDHWDKIKIPAAMSYGDIGGLSREVIEKLNRFKPESLGQASRISGITPSAVQLLQIHIKHAKQQAAEVAH